MNNASYTDFRTDPCHGECRSQADDLLVSVRDWSPR